LIILNSCGATTGARMVAKRTVLRAVSGTCCPTGCTGDSRRGLGVTVSVGSGFGGRVSWSRSRVLLLDPILKRVPQGERVAR
jgi:hypothetical protein